MMNELDVKHADMVAKLSKSGEAIQRNLTPHQAAVWHHVTGIGTEAGELLTAAKAYSIYSRQLDIANVIEELGDLEFYMQGLRMELGISREVTLKHNMEKLAQRYPGYEYNDQRAVARADKVAEQPQQIAFTAQVNTPEYNRQRGLSNE